MLHEDVAANPYMPPVSPSTPAEADGAPEGRRALIYAGVALALIALGLSLTIGLGTPAPLLFGVGGCSSSPSSQGAGRAVARPDGAREAAAAVELVAAVVVAWYLAEAGARSQTRCTAPSRRSQAMRSPLPSRAGGLGAARDPQARAQGFAVRGDAGRPGGAGGRMLAETQSGGMSTATARTRGRRTACSAWAAAR